MQNWRVPYPGTRNSSFTTPNVHRMGGHPERQNYRKLARLNDYRHERRNAAEGAETPETHVTCE